MKMVTVAFVLALAGWSIAALLDRVERAQRIAQLEAGAHLQNALLLWASERPQDSIGFTEPTPAEFQEFVDDYLPADRYGFSPTVTHFFAEDTFVVTKRFGKIERLSMTWPAGGGSAVEIRLFGSWDAEAVAAFSSMFPNATYECFPSGHTGCFGSTVDVPTHLRTAAPSFAFAIDVRHPRLGGYRASHPDDSTAGAGPRRQARSNYGHLPLGVR